MGHGAWVQSPVVSASSTGPLYDIRECDRRLPFVDATDRCARGSARSPREEGGLAVTAFIEVPPVRRQSGNLIALVAVAAPFGAAFNSLQARQRYFTS